MTSFPMIPVALFAEVGFGKPTVNHGVHALIGSRSRQSRRQPASGLGKIEMETVYHGDVPKKKRRLRQSRRPATRLGKFQRNPFIMAIAKQREIGLAKPCGSAKPFGLVKQERMALVVGAKAMLRRREDDLSDTEPMGNLRRRRQAAATGRRCCRRSGSPPRMANPVAHPFRDSLALSSQSGGPASPPPSLSRTSYPRDYLPDSKPSVLTLATTSSPAVLVWIFWSTSRITPSLSM